MASHRNKQSQEEQEEKGEFSKMTFSCLSDKVLRLHASIIVKYTAYFHGISLVYEMLEDKITFNHLLLQAAEESRTKVSVQKTAGADVTTQQNYAGMK